ncbi:condensation domain-containing protein, partial [Glaciibacter superstes]|uniref:condensation domain-containing protein n=1 Tax=Glaciibacter superstes TaxID=501023 RepID=UPI001FDF51EF
MRPESSEYSVPVALRLRGRLDDRALELALTAVVARHEILRTRIEVTGGVPRQIIDELSALNLGYKDLSAENTNAFSEFCESELQKPFRLDSGPLLRAHLVRRGKDDHILLIVLHHSIFDGWSTAVLLRDLDAAYSSLSAGKSAALPDLPVQYADYAAWQREWLSGEVLGTELRYWEDQLEGLVPVELPTDHSRPEEWDSQGKTTVMVVPAELAKSVVEIGRRRGATPFMVFLSAFQVLLGRYAGTSDISVGTPVAGRGRAETDDLIGFFVNTLVMRTRLGNGITFNRLVDQVRETVLDALNHQDLPFERLVQALSPERDLSRNPLIQVMFVLQNIDTDTDGLRIGDLSGELVRVESDTAKFDLTWTLDERADGAYVLDVQYARSLFEEGTIERMAGHFIRLLESISNAPSSQVARLDLLTQDERARLTRFEPGNNADKVSLSVVELFADSVARDPASVALIHGDEEMSY